MCTGSDDASLRIWDPKKAETVHVVTGECFILTFSVEGTFSLTEARNLGF